MTQNTVKVLFVNTSPAQCGVHQYGENMAAVLSRNVKMWVVYGYYFSEEGLRRACETIKPDFILYNWQQIIGGWMALAPFNGLGKQVLVFHDMDARFDAFDAVLFSDPTMPQHGKWFPIGRPLNTPEGLELSKPGAGPVTVGVNGFMGAWAIHAVYQAARQINPVHIRLHLPAATFGDQQFRTAAHMAQECIRAFSQPGVTWEVSHAHLLWGDLLVWLSRNTINLYVRNVEVKWRGVSSAIDAALCARRPVAINLCSAFRHMHDCAPSIVVEQRPLQEIIASGLEPLQPKYDAWSPNVVSDEVFRILSSL